MPDDRPIDILISYKREDRPAAERLARALALRWNVWWDHHLLAGDAYRKVIGEKLAVTRCVVVLWSARSIESDFVLDEAQRALRRGVLIPARIEAVDVPLGFGQQDYTDLLDWDGDEAHPGFQELCSAIAQRLGSPVPAPVPLRDAPTWSRRLRIRVAAVGGVAVLLLGLAMLMLWQRGSAPLASSSGEITPHEATPGLVTGTEPPAATALLSVQVIVNGQVIASGTVIPSGLVVTPCHVVNNATSVVLRGAGAWDGPATVVERHCNVDLALLEPARGPILPNGSIVRFAGSLEPGEAIERYRGASDRTPGKVITPIDSLAYLGDPNKKIRVLVTSNVSSGGDSGAPILDGQGRIVGLLVAGDGSSKSLAIPTETIREAFINRFAP
jgi:S1-C subfamily serine protease